ncbi:MarR family winged helix-turn-helix transcriptional regulator [Oceanisphaera psychrotolerans]|uniref:HTH marR-type domain-containing protein n=1 Tax=Oceanisphaera psychrotolerans TaxID=1414654 RepID=A0A1J4QCJ4_9GAMM|nr:MarR family winged helix-turn-helix transcriptional regulator [Oceanisphaera psychrotolerans]OIN07922.1 hypothetical protein BFR47_16015 [Oceanisphaera psychrotolerans]
MITHADISERIALRRLAQSIGEIREASSDLTLQAAHMFLLIAVQPGITSKEIIRETGFSQSSCSRNLAMLSKIHRLGKPGLDLVTAEEDPAERRRKALRLTSKGKELAARLADIHK